MKKISLLILSISILFNVSLAKTDYETIDNVPA